MQDPCRVRRIKKDRLTYRLRGERKITMKKVIRGRLYDTETAQEIGSTYGGGENSRDFHYWEEKLFRKRTGEYFLHCFGGAMSKYGVWHGNSGGSGEHIKPLSYEDAKAWAENALDGDKWVKEFGEPAENGDRTTIQVSMTIGAVSIIKKAAQKSDKSVSEMIEELIRGSLK